MEARSKGFVALSWGMVRRPPENPGWFPGWETISREGAGDKPDRRDMGRRRFVTPPVETDG